MNTLEIIEQLEFAVQAIDQDEPDYESALETIKYAIGALQDRAEIDGLISAGLISA